MIPAIVAVVFGFHLLCVNVASAGPLVAAGFDFAEGRGSQLAGRAGRYLALWAVGLLLPGGLLGLFIGWMFWDAKYYEVFQRLSSKIHFGAAEILFSFVLMGIQVAWWRARPTCSWWQRGPRIFIAVLASTNLLYHFPVLFAMIESLATSPEVASEVMTSAEFRARLADAYLLWRVAHFVLAAIATCGVVLLGLALRLKREQADETAVQRVAMWGGRLALLPTLLQIPTGLMLTASLPPLLQSRVTGGDVVTSLMFIASLALAFWFMQVLAAIAIGDAEKPKLIRAMSLLVVIVMLMSGVLHRLRATAAELADTPRAALHDALK